jgi:molybdenum cofactor cytidylyltransferase
MSVVSLILAAGQGRRFGADKRHARLPDGRVMLDAVVATHAAVLSPVWVVLRPGDEACSLRLALQGVHTVFCDEAQRGMGRSLAFGMRQVVRQRQAQAVVISLGDMPWVRTDTLCQLRDAVLHHGRAVLPTYRGEWGHPRALPRDCFEPMLALDGDAGARHLIDWAQAAVHIEVDDPGILRDVDTPADLHQPV